MASRGNKPLKKNADTVTPEIVNCLCCNKPYHSNEFYNSDSELYKSIGIVPYCEKCLDDFYNNYLKKYQDLEYSEPQRRAVERMCMIFNLYYNDKIYDSVIEDSEKNYYTVTLFSLYLRRIKLYQYRNKDYDTTIHDRYKNEKKKDISMSVYGIKDANTNLDIKEAEVLFGKGFNNEDYLYLHEQYKDWTLRHECVTKSQEEVFKQICFTQLALLKANRSGEDTKELSNTLLKQLDAAKLQPKQNKGDTVSDAQTFGTLIDKWENTRPLPEMDEELKDVDKIGLYINVFFKGHLAKMMGLKNGLSNLYTKFMEKYTVEKPEYDNDDNSDALFDAIFGGDLKDEQ